MFISMLCPFFYYFFYLVFFLSWNYAIVLLLQLQISCAPLWFLWKRCCFFILFF
jgi:hypothetical protein